MISHSPPIFSHSPPVSFLSDYMNNHRQHIPFHDDHSRTSIYCRPQMMTLASKVIVNNATAAAGHSTPQRTMRGSSYGGRGACLDRMSSVPLMPVQPKSCLSRRATNNAANNNNNNNKYAATDAHSSATASTATAAAATTCATTGYKCNEQSRRHKKVSFADDEGLSLTEVRVMSEPSNVPPYWSVKFLEQITQGLVSPQPADQWTVDFKQPASDYLSFRQKIDSEYVSLENVIVKDEESIIVGTVKVKNIDFEKEVIVRVTWDDWKSQQDIFCTYARAYGPATCAHVVFDTFSFKVTLPPSSKRLEFCICFRANELEYWDNNDNKNYTISKRSPFYYNALSPYVGNSSTTASSRNNSCQTQLNNKMSTLSEALAHANENQSPNSHHYNPAPSPYW